MSERRSILIIEDSKDLVELLYRRFESQYELSSAFDGVEGLALARSVRPDMVLLDVNLPRLGGFEILKEIRASDSTRGITVIMITALSDSDSVVEGLGLGADDYIAKPFSFVELSARIKAHLTIKDLQRQLVEMERLKTLHEVAVSFQHEINNPLTSITAFTHFLKTNLAGSGEELKASVDGIQKDVDRINSIMQELSAATQAASVDYMPGLRMIDFENLTDKGKQHG